MNEFHTLTDGEGVELESNVPFRFACCDCGLVHDMVIVSEDGKPVGFAIKRVPDATDERRAMLGQQQRARDAGERNGALEQAARLCESLAGGDRDHGEDSSIALRVAAEEIRLLKGRGDR